MENFTKKNQVEMPNNNLFKAEIFKYQREIKLARHPRKAKNYP